ncbi:HAD family hydrolase [Nitratidesulfovibrio sp. SRB-5]|uniref:HAD family hydrolase n=1 Tax=Nitratidesulfovibrio sp. SRB-5 TaxID=2872636 RepID=UPI001025CA20|nr:HAD family hydrolase [Nitratidesulfovibrio sp. SRB-5]MBZ2173395.1 HAD family hydrolase [Nitratidesulfovibrio sp. SRB-5]RXF77157.1 HAD family hydrolase [Desulfovibrio sp. DS-1]
MPIRAIIFDLDGTLLDTLEDLADAANACLLAQGLSAHPVDAYRQFVGDGVETLFRRALPPGFPPGHATEQAVAALVARMRDEYGARWSVKSAPYPGIRELLAALAPAGLPLGVLSNKPHAFTRLMVGSFFDGAGSGAGAASAGSPASTGLSASGGAPVEDGPLGPFAVVAGARPGVPRKPDPAAAIATARALGVDPAHAAFVGDSNVDMRTAHGAGMLAVGCLWGFRGEAELRESGASVLLAHPLELLDHI